VDVDQLEDFRLGHGGSLSEGALARARSIKMSQ
jgi:hypothetical protein